MPGPVGEMLLLLGGGFLNRLGWTGLAHRRRTAARGLAGSEAARRFASPFFLGEPGCNGQGQNRNKAKCSFHII